MKFLIIFALVFSLVSPRFVFAADGDVVPSGDPYYIYIIRQNINATAVYNASTRPNPLFEPSSVTILNLDEYTGSTGNQSTIAVQQYWLHDFAVRVNSITAEGKSYKMTPIDCYFSLYPWGVSRFHLNFYGDAIYSLDSPNQPFVPQKLWGYNTASSVSRVHAWSVVRGRIVDDRGFVWSFEDGFELTANLTYVGVVYSIGSMIQEELEGFDKYLVSVSSDLSSINATLKFISSFLQDFSNDIDSRLLQILDAINNLSVSGGGTSAVVGQLVDIKAELDEIDRNQINGTSAVTSALQSGVAAINKNATENQQRTEQLLHLVDDSINNVTDFLNDKISEDQKAAQESGDKISGLATKLQSQVSDKWGFLTYPVKFYQTIFSAFTGSRTAVYRAVYDGVVGYRYDDDSGGLVPIYDFGRATEPSYINGTTITFPSFSISIPGEGTHQVWGESDYNIASLKTQFPALFDAIYVASGILMCAWIVSHLLHVFNYVLGNSVEEEE